MQLAVSISDAKVTSKGDDTLITYSLGSCIGVALYDPVKKIAGLLHFQLPSASMDLNRSKENPFMFGDSGLTRVIELMVAAGAEKKRIKCKIAGGAKMLVDTAAFDIGKRNHLAIKKALWQAGIMIDKEDCGGNTPRTMMLSAADGAVTLKVSGELVAMN